MITAKPNTVYVAWIISAAPIPSADAIPIFFPKPRLFFITIKKSGPGDIPAKIPITKISKNINSTPYKSQVYKLKPKYDYPI